MPQVPIAPTDIRSLFRPHWQGGTTATAVLTAPPVLAAFRNEVRWGPYAERLRRADPDLDEHLHAGIVATLEYAVRGQGLAVPPTFWSRHDAGPFVALVFRHRLVDQYRRDSRLPVSHNQQKLAWYTAPSPPASAVGPTPRPRLLEYRRRLDDGSLRIGHALAFGAAHDLGLVQEVVDRLDAGTGPNPGLLRPARETAQLLQEWLEWVPTVPAPCRSRRVLAWIMRAADREGPNAWQARDPAGTTKAMDLLLKWQQRAEATLPARLLRELGPAVVLGVAVFLRGAIRRRHRSGPLLVPDLPFQRQKLHHSRGSTGYAPPPAPDRPTPCRLPTVQRLPPCARGVRPARCAHRCGSTSSSACLRCRTSPTLGEPPRRDLTSGGGAIPSGPHPLARAPESQWHS